MVLRLRAFVRAFTVTGVILFTTLVLTACGGTQQSHDFTLLAFENGGTAVDLAENERITDKFYQTWVTDADYDSQSPYAKTLYILDATIAQDPDIEEVTFATNDSSVGVYAIEGLSTENNQVLDGEIQQEITFDKKQATDTNQVGIRVDFTADDMIRDFYVPKLSTDALTIAVKYTDGTVVEKTYSFRLAQDEEGNDLFVITETPIEN